MACWFQSRTSIRIAIVAEGSRGDIQPYIALALHLQKRGDVVQVCTNEDHVPMCGSFGVAAAGVIYDAQKGMRSNPAMTKAMLDGNIMKLQKGLTELRVAGMPVDLKRMFAALQAFEPDVIVYSLLSRPRVMIYAWEHKVPAISLELQMLLPLTDRPPVGGLPKLPLGANRIWMKLILKTMGKSLPKISLAAKESLGLDTTDRLTMDYLHDFYWDVPSIPTPMCYAFSSLVVKEHPEWPKSNISICGFMTIGKGAQEERMADTQQGAYIGAGSHDATAAFIASGEPPVYIGWGSMLCKSPEFMVGMAVGALKLAGARGILLGGWAKFNIDTVPEELRAFCRDNVLFVETAAHEWLFPQCGCIVHHGGAGTSAASLRSGKPTIITPIMADQFDFADNVNRLGCGVGLPRLIKLTTGEVGGAIKKCLNDKGIIDAAAELGAKLRAEDGCDNFCKVLDSWYTTEFLSGQWAKKQTEWMQKNALRRKKAAETTCCQCSIQ